MSERSIKCGPDERISVFIPPALQENGLHWFFPVTLHINFVSRCVRRNFLHMKKKEKKRKIEMKPKTPAAGGDELCLARRHNRTFEIVLPCLKKTFLGPMYFLVMEPKVLLSLICATWRLCVSLLTWTRILCSPVYPEKAITHCVSLCEVTWLHKPHCFWKEVLFPKIVFCIVMLTIITIRLKINLLPTPNWSWSPDWLKRYQD